MNRKKITESLMTTAEAAKYLNVTKQAVQALVNKGTLNPVKRNGCITILLKEDVENYKKSVVRPREKVE